MERLPKKVCSYACRRSIEWWQTGRATGEPCAAKAAVAMGSWLCWELEWALEAQAEQVWNVWGCRTVWWWMTELICCTGNKQDINYETGSLRVGYLSWDSQSLTDFGSIHKSRNWMNTQRFRGHTQVHGIAWMHTRGAKEKEFCFSNSALFWINFNLVRSINLMFISNT